MNFDTFDIFALTLLLIMVVVLPVMGIWDFRRLARWSEEGRSDARIKTYNWIFIMEWGLTLSLLAWWMLAGRDLNSLGFVPTAEGWQWLAIGLGAAVVAFLIYQMKSVMGNPQKMEEVREEMGDLGNLAPQSPREDKMFDLVSVTAGICEEILYRGLLMVVLTPVAGIWVAVILTSLIFGLAHFYQGFRGIGKTALIGLVMALFTVFSGSLYVAILLHIIIDLTSGRMMGKALLAASVESP